MKPYKLKSSLHGHTGDVKSLCATKEPGGFASVSRDLTAKLWETSRDEHGQVQYHQAHTISVHTKFVNAVVVVYGVREFPGGLVITGSNDQTIAVHDAESKELVCQLREHQGAVCSLFYDHNAPGNGRLYSGSFDCSAKAWDLNALRRGASDFPTSSMLTVKGHDHTVWSVLAVEAEDTLLTASADKLVRQWRLSADRRSAEPVGRFAGHTDCVRGLALLRRGSSEFLSCSNDGCVLLWRLGEFGAPLKRIAVTDSFLYSVAVIGSGAESSESSEEALFMTSGEDRSLRISNLVLDAGRAISSCLQTIALPAQSVWSCACLNDGTLAVGCSDGSIRLFTQNEKQMASRSELEEFERELAAFSIPIKSSQTLSQINRLELPGLEALATPGRRDGQTLMVNNENEIEVYQWDSAESRWVKIGVAVGSSEGAGSGAGAQKVAYLGKDYDYVFDIELDDAGAKLKLPYNLSEDPYHAAQKFIHRHDLDQLFLDQIAQFIITNTRSQTIGPTEASSGTYYDPFTGEGRYVPPPASVGAPTTPAAPARGAPVGGGYDPFTGGGAYRTGDDVREAKKSRENSALANEFFPHVEYLTFDQTQVEPIVKKMAELAPPGAEANVERVRQLMLGGFEGGTFDLLFDMIASWPVEAAFPLIDAARLLLLSRDALRHLIKNGKTVEMRPDDVASSSAYLSILYRALEAQPANLTNRLVFCRLFSNLFRALGAPGARPDELSVNMLDLLLAEAGHVLTRLVSRTLLDESGVEKLRGNKALQTALATVLLNYSILVYNFESAGDQATLAPFRPGVLAARHTLLELLNSPAVADRLVQFDSEAVFRVLVALGNLLTAPGFARTGLAHLEAVRTLVNSVIARSDPPFLDKVIKCDNYLINILN